MNSTPLYPLKFVPQLKEKVWGGNKLLSNLGKNGSGKIGESWEISGVKDNVSIVANGLLIGQSLSHLIGTYNVELLGSKVTEKYGMEFPLLFKFIDAQEDLSVQLHPDDAIARERHNSFGKTEMWYILDAEKDARLILGFEDSIDKEEYLKHLSKGSITSILHSEKVEKGDSFFISPGTVHAIGGGILLAEIQQTSDITYRIYDWDRPDIDGTMRELHTDLSLDVIDFKKSDAKIEYSDSEDKSVTLCKSDYFKTCILNLSKSFSKSVSHIDSFIVYMCVEGKAVINNETIKKGETLLIPACFNEITITTSGASLLEISVP